MNTKFLRLGFLLLFVSAIFAATVIFIFSGQQNRRVTGTLVFAKSSSQIADIGEILIKTPTDTVTLNVDNNLWRIKEVDNYYANYKFIKELFDEINHSIFYRKQNNITETKLNKYDLNANGLSITVFDKGGQMLNSVIIGKKTGNSLYRFALLPETGEVYLVTGNYVFPKKLFSWMEQPLLALEENEVTSITLNNQTLSRDEIFLPFHFIGTEMTVNPDGLLKLFSYLPALDAISSQNFNQEAFSHQKNIKITTFDGLIVSMELYENKDDIWIKISLSTTTLPTTKTNDYIKNNRFLYDGWYFKINPVIGKTLFNYSFG